MTAFCLYGPQLQPSSFRVVMNGFAEGLRALGHEVFCVATDRERGEEDEVSPGVMAPVGVMFGVPHQAYRMKRYASHARRFCMVAPNSSTMTESVPRWVREGEAELLTPSPWGKEVLAELAPDLRCTVVPHGLGPEYARHGVHLVSDHDEYVVGHVTSTASDRKGTLVLAEAFGWAALAGELGPSPRLRIKADPVTTRILRDRVEALALSPGRSRSVDIRVEWVSYVPSLRDDFLKLCDVIAQPSRAEGFGLCGLEALASVVPVVATLCTGHSYLHTPWQSAVVAVEHGPEDESDDFEGAAAPTVASEAVRNALVLAYQQRQPLRDVARETAPRWYAEFAWPVVLAPWAKEVSGG